MSKLSLYRQYRSLDFADLVGQNHISRTLEQALDKGRLSHAYLFTGPRGTGKTSTARILARRVNEIESTDHHPDIIEIDAASNNGVDEIRDLREKVHVAPNYAKYKVYIIDEVHMLSTAAFNALLKTLEEPPSHVIFVLATTEPHKLPRTIISRTQHFPFHPISTSAIFGHLQEIAKKEKIAIEEQALKLIAELGEGSMRDGISLLDQAANIKNGKISTADVEALVGLAERTQVENLIKAVESGNIAATLKAYDQLSDGGVSPQLVLKQLLLYTREVIRSRSQSGKPTNKLHFLLETLSVLPATATQIDFALEAALLKACTKFGATNDPQSHSDQKPTVSKKEPENSQEPLPKEKSARTEAKDTPSNHSDSQTWVKALSYIKRKNSSIYSLLRSSDAAISSDNCEISAKFQFHYRRLNEPSSKNMIAEALSTASGRKIKVKIKNTKAKNPKTQDKVDTTKEDVDIISQVTNILGGKAV